MSSDKTDHYILVAWFSNAVYTCLWEGGQEGISSEQLLHVLKHAKVLLIIQKQHYTYQMPSCFSRYPVSNCILWYMWSCIVVSGQ